jgi:multimeric flavodoxin WrbA
LNFLGIVGSPRKKGRTNRLIDAVLDGASSVGAETKKIFLVDYEIKPYKGSGGSLDAFRYCPEELSLFCEEADAVALGAPVYWGDINGLTKDFMDSVRISNSNGKLAMGIAIAGGSGKGLLSGIQSIYHFFFHKQMRGVAPTPVSRFNMEEAVEQLKVSGARLTELSKKDNKFPGASRDECWPEALSHYASLKFLRCDPLDEFVLLARQLIRISKDEKVAKAEAELEKAMKMMDEGNRSAASFHAVKSYQILFFPP